jgi:hypothetical protein
VCRGTFEDLHAGEVQVAPEPGGSETRFAVVPPRIENLGKVVFDIMQAFDLYINYAFSWVAHKSSRLASGIKRG